MRKQVLLTMALLLMLSLGVTSFAQDTGNVVGDSDSESLGVVQNFLTSFDTTLLGDNVHYSNTAWAQDYDGRDSVSAIYQQFFNGVFTNVTTQPIRFIVSGESGEYVVAEYLVNGVNSGDYGMTPATGANVSIPTVSIFRVQDGMITEINTYADQTVLNQQLGIPEMGIVDPLSMGGAVQPDANMTDGEMQPDANMTEGETQPDANMTEGEMQPDANMTEGETQPDANMEVPSVNEGSETLPDTSIEQPPAVDGAADVAPPMGEGMEVSLDEVLDDPEAYYGQRLTIETELTDALSPQAFTLEDDDLLAADHMLVIYVGADGANYDFSALADEDQKVRATGTLRQFFLADFQNEFGMIDFSDEQFNDWEEKPVLIVDLFAVVESE